MLLRADETSKDAEYKLAQSGDATCNGLDSAEVRYINCIKGSEYLRSFSFV